MGRPAQSFVSSTAGETTLPARTPLLIIGSGFSGLCVAIRLLQRGIEDFLVLERADDVGGTWRDNTYPGCACDVPSHLYSFSFAPKPDWSRTYAPRQEIQSYLQDCARRFGVQGHIHLRTEGQQLAWDQAAREWLVDTQRGQIRARVVISANGPLSEPAMPQIPGMESFSGEAFHSARWRPDVQIEGRRVGVVGTGASAVQIVPHLQRAAEQLVVFQRTPAWVVPHTDRPITSLERWLFRRVPLLQRAIRLLVYWLREGYVAGFSFRPELLAPVERLADRHMRSQVEDPAVRARLTPDFRLGCKRILLSNDYFPALMQGNVQLAPAAARIEDGNVVDVEGTRHELDALIFATGFRVTDASWANRVKGRDGRTLADVWDGSPQAYLGAAVSGFPNLFLIVGPNTGLGHTSLIVMIEAQVEYVLQALQSMRARGVEAIEVREDVQERYNARLQKRLTGTVWNSGGCRSWYLDRNGRNSSLWPTFTWRYRQRVRRFRPSEYRAFASQPQGGTTSSTGGAHTLP